MATVIRVADNKEVTCNEEGSGNGGKSNGSMGGRQAIAMRVMAVAMVGVLPRKKELWKIPKIGPTIVAKNSSLVLL
jgi:hypothetical protein